jgi:glutathione S-transferase
MARDVVLPRFGITETDETRIAAAAEELERQPKLADDASRKSTYLASDQLTLADLFLAPLLFWLETTPKGQAALPKHAALARWYQSMSARPSFQATIPPMPGQAAA